MARYGVSVKTQAIATAINWRDLLSVAILSETHREVVAEVRHCRPFAMRVVVAPVPVFNVMLFFSPIAATLSTGEPRSPARDEHDVGGRPASGHCRRKGVPEAL